MTGFGEGTADHEDRRVTATVRSVNHRFADVRIKAPSALQRRESDLRRLVLRRVRRGRVELTLAVERSGAGAASLEIDRDQVRAYLDAAKLLREEFGVTGKVKLRELFAQPGVLVPADEDRVDDALWTAAQAAVVAALEAHERDRLREGRVLAEDLVERVRRIRSLVDAMRREAAPAAGEVRDRLLARLEALGAELQLDPVRVAQEAAVIADRADVTEELVRLKGHVEQLAGFLEQPDGQPLGKRIDFLLQEVHRETNTVGSKSVRLELSRRVIELKGECEKVREQTQNLE